MIAFSAFRRHLRFSLFGVAFSATSPLFGDIYHHLSFSATRFSATSLLFGDISHHLSFSATRFSATSPPFRFFLSAFFGDISAFRRHLSPSQLLVGDSSQLFGDTLLARYRRPPEAVFVWFTSPGRRPDVTAKISDGVAPATRNLSGCHRLCQRVASAVSRCLFAPCRLCLWLRVVGRSILACCSRRGGQFGLRRSLYRCAHRPIHLCT